MQMTAAILSLLIPVTGLATAAVPGGWLNARARRVGRLAEGLGWAFLSVQIVAGGLWVWHGRPEFSATLTPMGLFGVRIDGVSIIMALLVGFLGTMVLRFSRNYLAGDPEQGRYFKWMLFTLGAVELLCLAPGLLQFWLSWVACSLGLHHLLAYFPDRLGTLLSARKKFVVSRLGDLCLILAFLGIYRAYGTQSFGELFAKVATDPSGITAHAWVGWLIVTGAALKSAQFPFHTWLPDTMGTPTPVSALMHAGIINAGGFLVVRLSPLLVHTPQALAGLAVIGALTLTAASLAMLAQTSIKRSLAYSTIAQMGFMLLQCGLGAFALAVLHIVAHSLYKAYAFLSSGSAVGTHRALGEARRIPLPVSQVTAIAGLELGLVGLSMWACGFTPENKPGVIVLGVVLALALTQLVCSRLAHGPHSRRRNLAEGLLTAGAVGALYLVLAGGSMRLFGELLPARPVWSPAAESLFAAGLGACLLASIVLIHAAPGGWIQRATRPLYVHALNGFYLNTIANRLARSMGLVPPGR